MVRGKKGANIDPSYKQLKADYYPVQRVVNLASTATEVDYYTLHVDRCLSNMNHRLYRQGKTYSVKIDLDPSEAVAYTVYALVDTWYIQKAWQLARSTYMRATAEERAVMSKQQIARWEDFRVKSGLSGSAGQLVPRKYSNGLAGSADTAGDYQYSLITLADGTTARNFTWSGTAGIDLGILEEFDKSGDTDASPASTSADKAYSGVDPNLSELQMDVMAERGDNPPYDGANFNARVWVKIGVLNAAAAHGKLSTGYFNAPCGIVAIQPSVASTAINGQLTLSAQAGDYKGIKAHNMGV